ncbi:MAG: MarR family transcriptional regulator [Sedimentisphaerales bacterium]|nr:MarR family transcriptional regulator [Sedimentisphaerales bacterium]
MRIHEELHLNQPIDLLSREAVLSVVHTSTCIKKEAAFFFNRFGLTNVQFNVLMLLRYQSNSKEGLSQARLSEMMLVNGANITTLIDRMEKAQLVKRTADPADRRYNIIQLTKKGKDVLDKVEPVYRNEIQRRLSVLNEQQQHTLIELLERIRDGIRERAENR